MLNRLPIQQATRTKPALHAVEWVCSILLLSMWEGQLVRSSKRP